MFKKAMMTTCSLFPFHFREKRVLVKFKVVSFWLHLLQKKTGAVSDVVMMGTWVVTTNT